MLLAPAGEPLSPSSLVGVVELDPEDEEGEEECTGERWL